MLELAAVIVLCAIALTLVTDAAGGVMKLVRPAKRRGGNIHVADPEQSAS